MNNQILAGPYIGQIVKREKDPENDPEASGMEVLGRVKVRVPGKFEESAWAWPIGFGGSSQWGINNVPPLGAAVIVWVVGTNEDQLLYMPAHHATGMTFPEFEHPDVTVAGDSNFRFIYDRREGQKYAAMQVIKEVGGDEDLICEFRFDIEGNSVRIKAETGLKIECGGQLTIDAVGDIEIGGRKLSRNPGMI